MSNINWALCVPSACDAEDVELGVQELIAEPLSNLGLEIQVQVRKEMCQEKSESIFSIPKSTAYVGYGTTTQYKDFFRNLYIIFCLVFYINCQICTMLYFYL